MRFLKWKKNQKILQNVREEKKVSREGVRLKLEGERFNEKDGSERKMREKSFFPARDSRK